MLYNIMPYFTSQFVETVNYILYPASIPQYSTCGGVIG